MFDCTDMIWWTNGKLFVSDGISTKLNCRGSGNTLWGKDIIYEHKNWVKADSVSKLSPTRCWCCCVCRNVCSNHGIADMRWRWWMSSYSTLHHVSVRAWPQRIQHSVSVAVIIRPQYIVHVNYQITGGTKRIRRGWDNWVMKQLDDEKEVCKQNNNWGEERKTASIWMPNLLLACMRMCVRAKKGGKTV